MSNELRERLQAVGEKLAETVDAETLQEMADFVRRVNVLRAIHYTESLDHEVLAQWLYEDKQQLISVEKTLEIIDDCMPILIQDQLVLSDGLSDAGRFVALHYESTILAETAKPQSGGSFYMPGTGAVH